MQTPTPAATAAISIEAEGLSVQLYFALHPAAATLSSEGSITPDAVAASEYSPVQTVLRTATAAAPLLLQAFEQAQLAVAHSLANLSEAQLNLLHANSSASATATKE